MNKINAIIHLHTDASNSFTTMDSVTKYKMYVDKCKECGINSIAFTEHGNVMEWLHKKEYCEEMGIKYIHGVEAYVTEDLKEKRRDNYHVILLAKNYEGVKEINYLMSDKIACNREDGHFYYNPRITLDELINTSENVIISSACLGGIIGKGNADVKIKFIKFAKENKDRVFLEVQHHPVKEQIQLNKSILKISEATGIKIVIGTDTHSLNEEYADGRKVLQRSKGIYFSDEEGWDTVFKEPYELNELLMSNHSYISEEKWSEIIDNTNNIASMVEDFEIDRSHKYPKMYDNSEKVFKDKIIEYAKERKVKITDERSKRIIHELKTYKKNGAIDYMLLEEDVKKFARENNIEYGYSRGSVSGSYIAYLLKITDVDSIKYNLNFERFMSSERLSLADIDTDYPPSKRDMVRDYLTSKEGLYTAEIITFNTIAEKGAIRDVGRAFNMPLDEVDSISKLWDNEDERDGLIKKYPKLFKYVDLLNGVIVSVGSHPCGFIVSPHPIEGTIGTFTTTTSKYPITQLNMKEVDSMNYVKLDILGLENIEIINETCRLAGIERLTPDNTDYEDMNVWMDMRKDTFGIFQWASNSAQKYFQQLFSDETLEKIFNNVPEMSLIDLMTIGNGAIRPAGESYREELANGVFRDNGHEALNKFLASTMGYLVFQEQVIAFLNQFCGYTLGEADLVRRGFAKKTGTEEHIPRIKKGFVDTMVSKYNEDATHAEELIVNFLQVIEDASRYLFSINHSDPYSRIGYACGYLRYHHPIEFCTVSLNMYNGDLDKTDRLLEYMRSNTDITLNPIKFRYSQSGYSLDKSTNSIYKGMYSIKYINEKISEELYSLKDNEYNSFLELLIDIKDKTSTDARHLMILTKLDFFSEFGKSKKLLQIIDLYDTIYNRSQFKKDELSKLGISEYIIKKFSQKETPKLYKEVDTFGLVSHLVNQIDDKEISIKERYEHEKEYLGYLEHTYNDSSEELYYVTNFKTYGDKTSTPYLSLYQIATGKTIRAQITKSKLFSKSPFKEGSILQIYDMKQELKKKKVSCELHENKYGKMVDYKYITLEGEYKNVIENYEAY